MTRPWEVAELPEPVGPMYECPGPPWHGKTFRLACDLQWMEGCPRTNYPRGGFYCRHCVHIAQAGADESLRPSVVLGPTLEEEIQRRWKS